MEKIMGRIIEKVSPEDYLNLPEQTKRMDIKECKFIPPELEGKGFGHFEIEWHLRTKRSQEVFLKNVKDELEEDSRALFLSQSNSIL